MVKMRNNHELDITTYVRRKIYTRKSSPVIHGRETDTYPVLYVRIKRYRSWDVAFSLQCMPCILAICLSLSFGDEDRRTSSHFSKACPPILLNADSRTDDCLSATHRNFDECKEVPL